jgi:glycosyltransferase involved in cell wall biosynthesis
MRIGIFHPPLDLYGGAEVVAVATANALANSDFDVTLYVNRMIDQKRIKEMVGEALSSSIKLVINPIFLQPRGLLHFYENATRTFAFNSKCDILFDTYSNCIFPWTNIAYIHFPYINNFEFSENFPYLKNPRFRQALTLPYAAYAKEVERYQGKLLLTNSHFTARVIKESLGANSKVLYPPVSDVFFNNGDISSRENLVVTVARFGQGKGVELVPNIAFNTPENVKFLMIGLAHDNIVLKNVKNKIEKLNLQKRITLITNASREDITGYLSKAKVYLHTTKTEHFGISIAEAMAKGCIPVVHNSGGAPEFVPNSYRYDDLPKASQIVTDAIEHWTPEKSEKIKKMAMRFSQSSYSGYLVNFLNEYFQKN